MNVKYAGMRGKIQGEKNDKSPVAKDMKYVMDSVNMFMEKFQASRFPIDRLTGVVRIDPCVREETSALIVCYCMVNGLS